MWTVRRRTGIAWLVLAQGLLAGCSGPTTTPSSATPPAQAVSTPVGDSVLADATLFGKVFEVTADVPGHKVGIEGADVYCEQCGAATHSGTYTDANGDYLFPPGVWTEGRPSFPIRIWVHKDGYTDPAGLPKPTPPNPTGPGWREVVIAGDTRFDMELVRR
jgi:hypothetical protein